MDEPMEDIDESAYPDPGSPTLNPYPALLQTAQDLYANGSIAEEPNEYSQIASQFQIQHGNPQAGRNYSFPGTGLQYDTETDVENETDHEVLPMDNPYYDPGLVHRAENLGLPEHGSDEDPTFDQSLAEAMEMTDSDSDDDDDSEPESEVEPPRRGRGSRGRGRGRPRGRGRGGRGREEAAAPTESDMEGDSDIDTLMSRGSSRGRPRGRGRGGRGGARRGWKWALKGTEHDPRKHNDKPRKRHTGPTKGPLAKKSKKKQRQEDPGPVFKQLQANATDAYVRKDLEAALDYAREAVQANPVIYAAHSLLSDILAAKGDRRGALAALLTGANIAKDPDLWIMVADKTLDNAGPIKTRPELEQAQWCLNMAVKYRPEDYDARTRRRDLLLETGAYAKARSDTAKMLRHQPDDLENLKLYAELCVETREKIEITKAQVAYEEAFRVCGDKETFGDPEAQWTHLLQYLDLTESTSPPGYSVAQCKRIARWFLGRKDEEYWNQYEQDDREFDSTDDRRNLVPEYQASSSRKPECYGEGLPLDLRIKLGMYRLNMGVTYPEALLHFEHVYVLKVDMENVYDLFYRIADTLRVRKMFEPAIKFYEPIKVLEDELTDDFWINLASCYRGLKSWDAAEACYQAVMDLDPEHVQARIELAKMFAEDKGEKEKAIPLIRAVIDMGRKDILRKERLQLPPQPPKESARKAALEKKRKLAETQAPPDQVQELDPEEAERKRQKNREANRRYNEKKRAVRAARAAEGGQTVDKGGKRGGNADISETEPESDPDNPFIPAGRGGFGSFQLMFGDVEQQVQSEKRQKRLEEGLPPESPQREPSPRETRPAPMPKTPKQKTKSAKNPKKFAEIIRKDEDRKRLFDEQSVRIQSCFERVQLYWPALEEENPNEEEVFEWMDAAITMYREFRTMRIFYPTRDRLKTFKSNPIMRIRARDNKVIRQMEAYRKELEDGDDNSGSDKEGVDAADEKITKGPPPIDAYTPLDFHDIPFSTWHHIFVDLALIHAKQGDQAYCYEIIENGMYNANVFYHNDELINTTQATSICCALIFNDSERLIKTARWYAMRSNLRSGSAYQLLACVSRLAFGDNCWFTSGPSQKFMLRAVKSLDFAAMAPEMRRKYDFGMPFAQLKKRAAYHEDGLDPGALLNYGHMVSVANHSSSSLPYYFRAFAFHPEDPAINLSIATMFVSGAMKRQTSNRQYEIHQGLAFLYRYYGIRTRSGKAIECQEAEYNVARMWHMLGLAHLAIPAYERALGWCDAVAAENASTEQRDRERAAQKERARLDRETLGVVVECDSDRDSEEEREEEAKRGLREENFGFEAAYALQSIYAFVGNGEAARLVTEKYLVI